MSGPVGFVGGALGTVAVGLGSLLAAGLVIQGLEGLACGSCSQKLTHETAERHVRAKHYNKYRAHVSKVQAKKRKPSSDFNWLAEIGF